MKIVKLTFIIGMIFTLFLGCNSSNNNTPLHGELNNTLAEEDSVQKSDPWKDFSYYERKGQRLYDNYCLICHGAKGEGDGFNAYNLEPRPRNLADSTFITAISDATLEQIIAFGGRGVNRSVLMPAYQNTLSQDEISHVIAYIRTFYRQ